MVEPVTIGGAILHLGDMLAVLPSLKGESFHACVCDPPYEIGMMSKSWDKTGVAFRAETWAAVLRVLKPGAHLIAFSGTRTYHRMACAIEDAGFEIRDQLAWVYGSGYAKNHDVAKKIDMIRDGDMPAVLAVRSWLQARRLEAGRSLGEINSALGYATNGGGRASTWMSHPTVIRLPSCEQWAALKCFLGFGDEMDAEVARLNGRKRTPGDAWFQRPAIEYASSPGMRHSWRQGKGWTGSQARGGDGVTEEAQRWEGWGTALKPAWEPILLARKPLALASVGRQMIATGTSALNIRACKIPSLPGADHLWPANLCHDGSPELAEAFAASGAGHAVRFFYSAKADADDRAGSKHPTVKPVDLMRWLCRLVTPKGGRILDPFAGSGTTGEAAMIEGFRPMLIEREPEYHADIVRRLGRMSGAETPLFAETAA